MSIDLPPDDAQWHRLDPRMVLVHPVTEVVRALPALVGLFLASNGHGRGQLWSLAAAGVVALFSLTRWFTTSLRITAHQVELRRGLLRRQTIATARDRIRTVDVTSHVLHRALGLSRVVIGTGLNDRKGRGRIVLDGLPAATALRLRDDLLHSAANAEHPTAEHPAPVRPAPVRRTAEQLTSPRPGEHELAALERGWIRFAPFTLSGVLTGLIVWGFFWRVQSESQVDLLRHGPLRPVTDWITAAPTATAALVIAAGLVVFVVLTSTLGYVLAFWNFRLLRLDSGTLHVTRGLLTVRATSIERRRLAGVQLTDPLPLRWVGAVRTTAVATGLRTERGSERGGEVLLPPAPRGRAIELAGVVLDGSSAVTASLAAHPRVARRRRLVRALLLALVLAAAAVTDLATTGAVWPLPVAGLALLLALPLAADRFRNLGHAHVDGYLVVGTGSLVRRRAVVAQDAVIGWNMRSSPLQRRGELLTLEATTAAGRQGYPLADIGATQALQLADAVTPGLLSAFLVPGNRSERHHAVAAGTPGPRPLPRAHRATSR